MAKLNISGFLRTYTIAFGRVVINHSDVFVKLPTNRNTHVLLTKFPDFSWPPGAIEFYRDPAV